MPLLFTPYAKKLQHAAWDSWFGAAEKFSGAPGDRQFVGRLPERPEVPER